MFSSCPLFLLFLILLLPQSSALALNLILKDDIINTDIVEKGSAKDRRVLDPAAKNSDSGMRASYLQYKTFVNYTFNQITPGYKRNFYANYLNGDTLESKEYIIPGAGPPIETQSNLDFLVSGDGYFYIQTPQGPAFSSDGRFDIDSDGYLCTLGSHFRVIGVNGFIKLKTRKILVASDGTVFDDEEAVGQLKIVNPLSFDNVTSLNNVYFLAPADELVAAQPSQYEVRQGYYEASSVPKALGPGDTGRQNHMYFSNTYMLKRAIRATRSGVQMGN